MQQLSLALSHSFKRKLVAFGSNGLLHATKLLACMLPYKITS